MIVSRMLFIATVAAATIATPALAQEAAPSTFTGARIGANVGFADDDLFGTEVFTYGVEGGYDVDLGGAVVGATAEVQDSKDTGRDLSLTARAGVKATPTTLVYGLAGYSNLKVFDGLKLDGLRLGAGVEVAAAPNVSVKFEQRYTDYELGAHIWQSVVGIGFRF